MKSTNAMLDCKLQFKVYTVDLQIDLGPKPPGSFCKRRHYAHIWKNYDSRWNRYAIARRWNRHFCNQYF